jgi:ABC-type glutathione transport system ATPase component
MNADGPLALIGRNLHKSFRREQSEPARALNDVSIEIRHGALTALVGPDGAGKTTLIRLAAGLMPADSGTLEVLGFDVAATPQLRGSARRDFRPAWAQRRWENHDIPHALRSFAGNARHVAGRRR